MATYSTDFSEYTTGLAPSDWTPQWHTGAVSLSVQADASLLGGQYLLADANSQDRYRASWDVPSADPNRGDFEILAKGRVFDETAQLWVSGRISGGTTNETAYSLVFSDFEPRFALHFYNSGTAIELASMPVGPAQDVWYWLRFRVDGTTLQGKYWEDGDPEPEEWMLETTDSSLTDGLIGIGHFRNFDHHWDWFSVGTNGDTAPGPADDEITGSGDLLAGDAEASGSGISGSTGTGAVQADNATASGAGTTGSTGTGALEAGASAVEGTGTVGFIEITGSGDLQAGDSAVAGEGASGSTGTGSLASRAAAAAGAGISGSTGAGDVAAQPSAAEGAGVTGSTGSGALEAQPAIVHGTAENIVTGSGALQAGDAEASGEGLSGSTGSGAVAAGAASADGSGDTGSTGAGALVVAFPTVAGVGASGSTGSGELQATGAVIEGFDIPAVTLGRIAVTQSAATSISVSTRLAAGISTSARALTDLEATESAA